MVEFPRIDAHLEEAGVDGYLIDAAADSSDQRYLSGYDAPDPFFTLYEPDRLALLVSGLEYGRAREHSRGDVVYRFADFDYDALRAEHGATEGRNRMVAAFLEEVSVGAVAVPPRFPVATADGLRDHGVRVRPDHDEVVTLSRARKTAAEVDHVRRAQRANEAALRAAEDLLAEATDVEGVLHHDGDPLTAERVRAAIELALLRNGCAAEETIVAPAEQGADPHERGHGPIPADEPVVIDVFPRDKETKYHADMTRTLLVGEPAPELTERYAVVEAALEAGLEAVEPGVSGETVHDAACDVIESAGYQTLRSDPQAETGFIHSTGHGVGLDIHEFPRLAPGGTALEPGHIVTVEPGLYDPAVGGVRLEDIVVVTPDGHENLTDYPLELVVA